MKEILDSNTVRVSLKHFQQAGFKFAAPGDEVWFIKQPNPNRSETNTVSKVYNVDEQITDLTFTHKLPQELRKGDVIENKTWNPTYTMRGCTIRHHRARNLMLKTPLKTVIEDNYFQSMMSSIMFRGELLKWYESGSVEDVLIQNNTFHNCVTSGSDHAVLNISPHFNDAFDKEQLYDKNIRFINNTINTTTPSIFWADRVDGLLIKGNKINFNRDYTPISPNSPMINLQNSNNVTIMDNIYSGAKPSVLYEIDDKSKKTFKNENNQMFK